MEPIPAPGFLEEEASALESALVSTLNAPSTLTLPWWTVVKPVPLSCAA